MSRDIVPQCLGLANSLAEAIARCTECIEVFVDYSHLRYPYLSISVMLMKCDNYFEECDKHLYSVVLELTLSIEPLYRGLADLERDIATLRVRCGDGWLEYGYSVQRSSAGVPYMAKGFHVVHGGRRTSIPSVDRGLIDKLGKALDIVVKRAREAMECEGII